MASTPKPVRKEAKKYASSKGKLIKNVSSSKIQSKILSKGLTKESKSEGVKRLEKKKSGFKMSDYHKGV